MRSRTELSALFLFLITFTFITSANAGIIEGRVVDYDSGEPVGRASVRVENSGRSIICNDDGYYRLRLMPGSYQLKFSHIAHFSEKVVIEVPSFDSTINLDIRLHPSTLELKPIRVYERAYDPAQKIIIEAIRRKEEILAKINDYTFEAYTKMVLRDTTKDDSSDILLIAEAQQTYYWQKPDTYKEIITARKQSANLEGEDVLVAVGGILNLNQNRIDMNEYSVVSPTAKDALDYYNYYLLDTIYIDSKAVFRLEFEPKSDIKPLFVGIIDIADSTFEVAGVNIGFNDALKIPYIDNLKFHQNFTEFENSFWMPIEQSARGIINIPIPGIPVLDIDYVAAIYNYKFNEGHPKGTFDEFAIEVAEDADDVDSTSWLKKQTIPLTAEEIRGYQRIDSVENAPKPIWKKALLGSLGLMALTTGNYDFFHFNRVEGAYLGVGFEKKKILPRLDINIGSGYAIDRKFWEHNYRTDYALIKSLRLKVGGEYFNKIAHREMIMTRNDFNPTFMSLLFKVDQLDYFREEGYSLHLQSKLLNKTQLSLSYRDVRQWTEYNSTDYGIFNNHDFHRVNPQINGGNLRSLSAEFEWDSRRLIKNKNEISPISSPPFTILKAGIEYANPDFIDNDFDFRRYSLSLNHRMNLLGLGRNSLFLYAGGSDGTLPPQRYFVVDYGGEGVIFGENFKTMGEQSFVGNRAGAIYMTHNFGTYLFRMSRLPLIKKIPFSLLVYGGIFWTEFKNHTTQPGDDLTITAERPYREIGFGIGRLPPLNLKLMITWQLSDYNTSDFSIDISMGF